MRAKSLLTLLQHILLILVAIKTALYLKVDKIFGLGLNKRNFYSMIRDSGEQSIIQGPPFLLNLVWGL